MHEGGRRNARVVGPWKRDSALEIHEEFASRAARAVPLQSPNIEEPAGSTDVEAAEESGLTGHTLPYKRHFLPPA